MLRDANCLSTAMTRRSRLATFAALLVTMLLVAGLRANQPVAGSGAALTVSPVAPQDAQPLSLEWVPNGSLLAFAIRPGAFLEHPEMVEAAKPVLALADGVGVNLREVGSITVCVTDVGNSAYSAAIILRNRRPTDWAALRSRIPGVIEGRLHDQTVYSSRRTTYCMPDDRTLILGSSSAVLAEVVQAGRRGTSNRFWHEQWKSLADKSAAILFDIRALRETESQPNIADSLARGGQVLGRALFGPVLHDAMAPMFRKGELVAASVTTGDQLSLRAVLTTLEEDDAKKAQATAQAGLVLLGNMLQQQQRSAARSRNPDAALLADLMGIGEALIRGADVHQQGTNVVLTASTPWNTVSGALAELAPALERSLRSTRVEATHNNLKQIALALHNYHAAHGAFPPAYSMGRDGSGKHPVSWRVLITPFLEHPEIFRMYHFDEPWDSPHNRRVTASMPPVFGHPDGPSNQNTAYFAVVSPDARRQTGFSRHEKRKIADFIDGTSNSLLVVEARRDVHWAKPEDIEWNPAATEMPRLGGFRGSDFAAAWADGSVGHFTDALNPDELRKMLTINDRQPLRRSGGRAR